MAAKTVSTVDINYSLIHDGSWIEREGKFVYPKVLSVIVDILRNCIDFDRDFCLGGKRLEVLIPRGSTLMALVSTRGTGITAIIWNNHVHFVDEPQTPGFDVSLFRTKNLVIKSPTDMTLTLYCDILEKQSMDLIVVDNRLVEIIHRHR
jgi:hypothetical protein